MPKKSKGDAEFEFEIGQIVLAYFGQHLYEAKIMTRDIQNGQPMYFVHYQKWDKKHDEWLAADRVLLKDEAGLKQQQQLRLAEEAPAAAKKSQNSKRKSAQSSSSEDDEDEDSGRGSRSKRGSAAAKKRKAIEADDDDDSLASDDENSNQAKLILPPTLQKHLLLDFEAIKQSKKLVTLPKPADKSVASILEEWKKGKGKKDKAQNVGGAALTASVADGLRSYFDKLLPVLLLYPFEAPQHQPLASKTPSNVYGVEHLLRLFSKLPELLAQTEISDVELKVLMGKFSECLKFINALPSHYFGVYTVPNAEYLAQVKEEGSDE